MKKKITVGIVFFMLIVLLGGSLTYLGLFSKTVENKEQKDQVSRMTIALVNEDAGTDFQGKQFSLGENYTKKVEQDTKQNWYLVSRSIAESGLANDTYNLMIVIPSNFSENVFSLSSVAPERTEISYKINANGNKDVENEALKVAKTTISELNKELVDVYIASILDNLYTAQKNVGSVVANQKEKVGIYSNSVFKPVDGYTKQFEGLKESGDTSVKGLDDHSKLLASYLESVVGYNKSQTGYDDNLQKLIETQLKNQEDYKAFSEEINKYNLQLSSEETQELYDRLVTENKLIGNEFTKTEETSLLNQVDNAGNYITEVEKTVDLQKNAIDELLADNKKALDEIVRTNLKEIYGLSEADSKLTLENLLQGEEGMPESKLAAIKAEEFERLNALSSKLATLLYLDGAMLESSVYLDRGTKDFIQVELEKINNYLNKESGTNNFKLNLHEGEILTINPDDYEPVNNEKIAKLDGLKQKLNQKESTIYTKTIVETSLVDYSFEKNIDLSLTVPSGVLINKVSIIDSKGDEIDLDKEQIQNGAINLLGILNDKKNPRKLTRHLTMAIEYQLDLNAQEIGLEKAPKDKLQLSVTPYLGITTGPLPIGGKPPEEIETNPNDFVPGKPFEKKITLPFNAINTKEYRRTLKTYHKLIGEYQQEYKNEVQELSVLFGTLNEDGSSTKPRNASRYYNELRNDTDVFGIITRLMMVPVTNTYNDYLADFITYQEAATKMAAQLEELNQKMVDTTETTKNLNQEVDNQLENLSKWQKEMASIESNEMRTSLLTESEHETTKMLHEELKMLVQESERLKETSESNIESANSIKKIFDDFNEDTVAIQKSGENVTANTKDLMGQFKKQTDNHTDFSKTFNKVLENGQQNGVLNNQFVDFLSAPVSEQDNGRISSGDTYYPYLIIVALFITSIFTSYVLDLSVWKMRKVNSFQEEDNLAIRNLPMVLLGVTAAIIEGLVIGILSFRMQGLNGDIQLTWLANIILLQIVFVLLTSYLLRQFKMLGMFMNLVLFTAYLLLTDAVGKAIDSSSIFYKIRTFSPLYQGESILSNVSNQIQTTNHYLLYLIGAIPLLILLNLVVWLPNFKKKTKVEGEE